MGYFRDNVENAQGYVPGFQPSAADVVKLNTNENPYPPSPKVMAAIAGIGPEQLRRYPDPLGSRFRKAAANLNGVEPENIICVNGGDELLSLAVRAFCDSRKPMAYPIPTYTLYPVLARLEGCPVIEVPFDSEFNLPAKLSTTGAALTIVCNPNAPSGTFVPVEEIASLADELKNRGVLLIDEAYADFAPCNCASLVKTLDNVIILRSMSKGYSLAGLRFGYGIACAGLIDGLLKVKDSYNVNAIAIEAATAAIEDQTAFLANVKKVKAERARLTASLRSMGVSTPESHANFVFARMSGTAAKDIHDRLAGRGIYVRYFGELPDRLRISVGTSEQNDKLLEAMKQLLQGCKT